MSTDHSVKILGVWRVLFAELEYQATGKREQVLGKNPTGFAIFTSEGRFMIVMTSNGRKAPNTDQDWAGLITSMVAYTGLYRLDGDRWITKVDVAWQPAMVGTEQVRFFRLEEDRLHVTSPWQEVPNWAEKGMSRAILTFERVK